MRQQPSWMLPKRSLRRPEPPSQIAWTAGPQSSGLRGRINYFALCVLNALHVVQTVRQGCWSPLGIYYRVTPGPRVTPGRLVNHPDILDHPWVKECTGPLSIATSEDGDTYTVSLLEAFLRRLEAEVLEDE